MGLKASLRQDRWSEPFLISAATLVFFPLVLFLRLIGGTWLTSNHHYPSLVQSGILFLIVCSIWLAAIVFFKKGIFLSGLERYLLPFLAALCISTIFSTNNSLSAEKALGSAVFFILGLILLELRKTGWIWDGLINSILLTALFTTFLSLFSIMQALRIFQYSILDILSSPALVLRSLPRMPDILNLHITISAGYYLMVSPLAAYRFLRSTNRIQKIILLLGGGASLLVFFLIQSRGSMIGLGLMVLCALFLERKRIWELIGKHRLLALGLGVCGLALIGIGFGYIISSRGFSLTESRILCRFEAWKISLDIIQQRPLFGSGMETFGYQFLDLRRSENCSAILHVTHNDLLQLLVNFGLLGLGGLSYFGIKYLGAVRSGPISGRDGLAFSLTALAGLFGMGLMTTMLYSPNIRFLLIFYLVWMIPDQNIKLRGLGSAAAGIAIPLMILLGAGGGWIFWKIQPYYQARISFNAGEYAAAEEWLETALERDPGISYYHQALAFVKGQSYCASNQDLSGAIDQYQRSLDQVAIFPADYVNFASLLEDQGDFAGAAAAMDRAVSLNLQKGSYRCFLGKYQMAVGESQKALASLASCIAREPLWLDTPFWDGLEISPDFEDQVLALAVEEIQEREEIREMLEIGRLFYFHGKLDQAREYLELASAGDAGNLEAAHYLALISMRQGNYQDAAAFIQRVLDLNPRCQGCWLILAETALEAGDLPGAERALGISSYLLPSPGAQVLSARLLLEKGDRDAAAGSLGLAAIPNLPLNNYSHWISSRWSFETSHLKCVPAGLTYQGYYLPISEGGAILEKIADGDLFHYYRSASEPDRLSRDYFKEMLQQSAPGSE